MKRIKVLIGVILTFAILSGCGMPTVEDVKKEKAQTYFIKISDEFNGIIVYDVRTGVEYWLSDGMYNYGTLSPLYNADGSLMIYKGGAQHDD